MSSTTSYAWQITSITQRNASLPSMLRKVRPEDRDYFTNTITKKQIDWRAPPKDAKYRLAFLAILFKWAVSSAESPIIESV